MPDLDPCGSTLQTTARQYIAGAGCTSGYSDRELLSALLLATVSGQTQPDYEPVVVCGEDEDGNQIPVLITYAFEPDGTIVTTYTDLTTNTPYVGDIVMCDDVDWQVAEPAFFCDNGVQTLIRRDIFRSGVISSTTWTDLAGNIVAAPNPVTLTAGACGGESASDVNVTNGAGAAAVNIQDGGNSITVDGTVTSTLASVARTTTITSTSASASTTAGIRSVTFIVTTGPVTIGGVSFGTGSTLSISAPLNDTLNAIAYNATGGVLKIIELN